MKEVSLEEFKKIELEILKDVHNFCVEHNLKYSIYYGTLLGAIRHKGFIPWDDDIDIAMPREDYDYFISNYDSDKYGVMSPEYTKYYFFNSAKAYDKRTIKKESINTNRKFLIGIEIDVFPLDYIENEKQYDRIQKRKRKWNYIRALAFYPKDQCHFPKNIFSFLLRPFGTYSVKKINKIGQKYNSGKRKYFCANGLYGNEKQIYPIDLFDELELLQFEKDKYYASSKYHEILTKRYGDYMTPPKKVDQETHHDFKCYYR